MALIGVILGEILDAAQADETAAHTIHQQRSDEAREVDDREHAERQTDDLQEWLAAPDQVDFTPVDTPVFAGGWYQPTKEFDPEVDD